MDKKHDWRMMKQDYGLVEVTTPLGLCRDCGLGRIPVTETLPCPPWAEHESGGITKTGQAYVGGLVQELKTIAYLMDLGRNASAYDLLQHLIRTHEGQAET